MAAKGRRMFFEEKDVTLQPQILRGPKNPPGRSVNSSLPKGRCGL